MKARISIVSPEVVQCVASRMLDPMHPLMGYFAHTGETYRNLCGASAEEDVIDATPDPALVVLRQLARRVVE
jgi:hypothetical protein